VGDKCVVELGTVEGEEEEDKFGPLVVQFVEEEDKCVVALEFVVVVVGEDKCVGLGLVVGVVVEDKSLLVVV
jgi:hypothetical protein